MRKFNKRLVILFLIFSSFFLGLSCVKEETQEITIDFSYHFVDTDMVPARVSITNNTKGADTYQWTFEGASPNNSTQKNPGELLYPTPGTYIIRLVAENKDGVKETLEKQIEIKPELVVAFSTHIVDNNFPPVTVNFTNNTVGATEFQWTFEGGTPAGATDMNPGSVVFENPGEHIIRLVAGNGTTSYEKSDTIVVAPHLHADFNFEVPFLNQDMQVPLQLSMNNLSVSATDFVWQFDSGSPATSTDVNPVVSYDTPGTYTISLQASNGKETDAHSIQITLLPNTNLVSVQDMHLGINTAHNNNVVGAFYATQTGLTYTDNEIDNQIGPLIDLVFYGLNSNFGFNKFVSPDQVTDYALNPIPDAQHTKFINKLESCNCDASLSVTDFDNMTDDSLLSNLTITETPEGLESFDNQLVPRIVLFETQDGRKGAIKIKEYINNGSNSYINVDMKFMKQTN